jgi:hypothetical protein
MKHSSKFSLFIISLILLGCTQAQLNQAAQIAVPLAETATVAAGAYYGVPPTTSQAIIGGVNSLWGAYQQAQAGQPVSQGAVSASVGNAIQQATAGLPQSKQTAALQAAATLLQAQVKPAVTPAGVPVSLWNSSPTLRNNVQSLSEELHRRLERDARKSREHAQ